MFYAIYFAIAIIAIGALIITKAYKLENQIIDKILKIVCVVWMSLHFLNMLLPDGFVLRSYDDISMYKNGELIWYAMVRWIAEVSFVVLPIAVFYKKELFNKYTAYIVLAVNLLDTILYFKNIEFFTDPNGQGIMTLRFFDAETRKIFINTTFRSIWFGVLQFLELMLAVFITLRNKDQLKLNKDVKKALRNVGLFILLLITIVPIYVPQYLTLGYSMVSDNNFDNFKMGTPFHFIWIAFVIIEGIVLTIWFRKKSYTDRYILMVILALALFIQYHTMFTCVGEITAHRFPFQLCNMAPLFILLMLFTKSEKIYHFTIVINSVGAIIAMILCDTTPYGVSYVMNVHYILEHTNVILIPILCATLGIFAPLKTRDIKHFVIGFTMYFTFVLIVGGIFTGLKESIADQNIASYWNCNYLYMFNKTETVGIVGFVGPLFDAKIKLFNFFTLSLVQPVIYLAFTAICTGAFFLIKLLLKNNKAGDINHGQCVNE